MDIYKEYFTTYYNKTREYFLNYFESTLEINEENYSDIVFQPADAEAEIWELRNSKGIELPQHFLNFYKSCRTLEIHQIPFAGITIATACVDQPGRISNWIDRELISPDSGLIPFGTYQDEWEICLDISGQANSANPPIRLFELSSWREKEGAISPKVWFSSFDNFILCLTDYLKSDGSDNFSKLDPNNNFETAYPYWNQTSG